jgi:uncharacterized protein YjbJ (UPF0337 family)
LYASHYRHKRGLSKVHRDHFGYGRR